MQHGLRHEKFDKIYSSDLKRATETARIIRDKRNIEIIISENLRELNFGTFEGLTFDEIVDREPDWKPTNFDFTAQGGENLEQLVVRMKAFYADLINDNPVDSTILVVSHSGCLHLLICSLLGLDFNKWHQIKLELASITIFENITHQPVLTLLNDTCHLKEGN